MLRLSFLIFTLLSSFKSFHTFALGKIFGIENKEKKRVNIIFTTDIKQIDLKKDLYFIHIQIIPTSNYIYIITYDKNL